VLRVLHFDDIFESTTFSLRQIGSLYYFSVEDEATVRSFNCLRQTHFTATDYLPVYISLHRLITG